jgi:hypothetical protein
MDLARSQGNKRMWKPARPGRARRTTNLASADTKLA